MGDITREEIEHIIDSVEKVGSQVAYLATRLEVLERIMNAKEVTASRDAFTEGVGSLAK